MKILISGSQRSARITVDRLRNQFGSSDIMADGGQALAVFLEGMEDNPNSQLLCLDVPALDGDLFKPKKRTFTTKCSMRKPVNLSFRLTGLEESNDGYFKEVYALHDYQLQVVMTTGATIQFDFRPRLNTVRFGGLKDKDHFRNVRTDGNYLIFEKTGKTPMRITASEFMDLVFVDRRK